MIIQGKDQMPATSLGDRSSSRPSRPTATGGAHIIVTISGSPDRRVKHCRDVASIVTCLALIASAIAVGVWAAVQTR